MKYCSHCGSEIMDEAVICPKCGCPVEGSSLAKKAPKTTLNADLIAYLKIGNVVLLALLLLLATIFSMWVNYLSGFVMYIISIVFTVSLGVFVVIDFLKGARGNLDKGWLACKLFVLVCILVHCICWIALVGQIMR